VEKSFSKNPRLAAILAFLKNFFPQNLRLTNQSQKKIEKILDTLRVTSKKSDFDPPFWIEPPFLTHLARYALDLCC
jgi:hypothetical protein